jgi:hypothetical protein
VAARYQLRNNEPARVARGAINADGHHWSTVRYSTHNIAAVAPSNPCDSVNLDALISPICLTHSQDSYSNY